MNIIGILIYDSTAHARSAYSHSCFCIGIVLFIGIVPYKAVVNRDVHCSIIGNGNTWMRVPESWNPVDAVTIFIGPYVRCISNILPVLA